MTAPPLAPAPATRAPGDGTAVLMVLGSCVSLQVGAALAAQLFDALGSTGVTLLRLAVAAAVLLAVTRPRVRRWDAAQWRSVVLLGLALAGMNGCFYAAIARIPLGAAVTIEFLGPLALAAVLSRRLRDVGWVLLAAAGVLLLGLSSGHGGVGAGGLDPVGVAFALVAAVFWALYILASARVGAAVPGQGGLAVAMGVGALALVPGGAPGVAGATDWAGLAPLVVGTALLASVVPYSLELAALRRLPRAVFGVLLSLEPAVAAVAGWLLLAQALAPLTALAIGVVVLASAGSTLTSSAARRAGRPAEEDVAPAPVG